MQNGILQPGDSSISTFTLKAKLTLQAGSTTNVQINKTGNTFDKIAVAGALVYGGTLQIDTVGSFAAGDVFKIFIPASATSGTFTNIVPATPGAGLQWKFKPATGELSVVTPGFVEAPTNLALTAATNAATSTSTVTATWTDNSDNELYFVLERSLDSLSFTDIAHPAANATTYTDSSRTPNTKYYYRIKAVGTTQESTYSTIKSITTPALYTPPAMPTNPVPANNAQDVIASSGNLALSWTGSSNTTTYTVYFGTDSSNLMKLTDIPYSTAPIYSVTGLTNFTQYYWRINAFNAIDTTTGTLWNFRTALAPAIAGDYRAIKTGYYDSVATSTGVADVWEMYNGTAWVSAAAPPSGSVNTVTIKNGYTVSLRGTTQVKNLVIETGATLKSFTSNRVLRVSNSIINNGTLGSSSTAAERVNFEGYLPNGTITLGGNGLGKYYLVNLTVNNIAVATEVMIDADLNLTGYIRGNYSNSTAGVNTAGQDDDSITITINTGRTVIMGSSSYLQEGSSPTTNTITNFGKYIYNINGTLDMKATGTSCIVAHSTKAASNITINVNGTWYTGNAMRLASTAATVGTMNANIGPNGVVDAGARAVGSTTATNMVFYNALNGQIFYNISGNGVLKNKIGTTEVLYPIGTNGTYSPTKLTNTGTADIIAVGVKNTFDNPVPNLNYVVNKQFSIAPATVNMVNLAIALGWLPTDQATGFSTTAPMVVGHYGGANWDQTVATFSGSGTIASPYFAKASGFTAFSPFIVANANPGLPVTLLSFSGSYNGKKTGLLWNTTNEINIKNFVVERSSNGTAFTGLGSVDAKNSSGVANYVFTDLNPLIGISYYRLKIMEQDGSSRYSKIVTINSNGVHAISVYPNPAVSNITVLHPQVTKPATLQLLTVDGKVVRTMALANGATQTNVDITSLAKGTYLVTINDGSAVTLIFTKQ